MAASSQRTILQRDNTVMSIPSQSTKRIPPLWFAIPRHVGILDNSIDHEGHDEGTRCHPRASRDRDVMMPVDRSETEGGAVVGIDAHGRLIKIGRADTLRQLWSYDLSVHHSEWR